MQKFSLVMLLLVTSSMVFNDAFATQIQIVTDLGNVFTVQKTSLSNGTNGSSIAGAGLGTVARIQTVQPQGTLVYGSGYIGTTTPIQPYVSIPQGTNFAALIQNNDNSVSLPMPEFYATYDYINGRLVQEPGPSNILSFTDTKMLSGNLSPTLSTNGIQITGNPSGTMVLKLNSLAGRQVVLRGTIPSGDNLQYVLADSSIDLTNMPYDGTNGWHLATTPTSFSYSGYYPTYSWTCGYVHPYPRYPWYYYWTCWQYQSGSYPTAVSASAPLDFTVSSQTGLVAQLSATYAHTCSYHYGGKGWGGYRSYTCYSTVTYPASISGYQTANGFHVTGVSYTDSNYNGVTTGLSSGTFVIYDKTPYSQLLNLASNFEQTYTFPNDNRQLYLISTQPNANTIIASAQPYDPNTFSYLKIKGVPPNIPYEIVKNNMVGVTGLSPSDGSAMTFQVSDIGLQARGDSPGGTMVLYPNSLWYRGTITSLVLDTVNKNSFNYNGPLQIHVPFAFIRVPIPATMSISKTTIDDSISVPYLSGQYQPGTALLVPTLPSMKDVSFSANGTPMKIAMSDVIGGTGVTVFSGKSASDSHYSLVSAVSADAGVDSEASVIATSDGTLNAIISLSVSASASYYSGTSTLSVYVKTYVNGNLIGTKTLYASQPPLGYSSQTVNHYQITDNPAQLGSYSVVNPYPYSVDTYNVSNLPVSGTVSVPVHTGDLVEFDVYVGENVNSGLVTTSYDWQCDGYWTTDINTYKPSCLYSSFVPTSHVSEASATVSLGDSYILTG